MFRKSFPTLLQDHFTEDQFERIILKNTGEKKLRPFATPSIFLHRPVAKPRKPPPKRTRVDSTDDPKVKQNTQADVEPQPVDTENDVSDMQPDPQIPAPFQPESTQAVRELGQPLPTERTLHRHLEGYKFTPGLLEDIMESLALKVRCQACNSQLQLQEANDALYGLMENFNNGNLKYPKMEIIAICKLIYAFLSTK
ncbi:hypothetical protein HPB50_010034 [Hyalomma asiaticum]|uniref:Uncharacterized protein n=1 Tax=Hyalomma asiaticum TaxID=266040 RepID=A0ACB7SI52_HYAAI|nr:hypothetical protein HPB50_010034 [Hyalomma asiaticum]